LDNHALTLKHDTAKYNFGEKSSFCVPSKNFVVNQGNFNQAQAKLNFFKTLASGIAILMCNVLYSVHCTLYSEQALSEEEKPGQSLG
jgi:hypothetical protein